MIRRIIFISILILLAGAGVGAQVWRSLGPPGGDVHSLAVDPVQPGRLYLGTADGHIFGSTDAGEHWTLLGRAGTTQDAVITAILVDPRDPEKLFASAWSRGDVLGGGVFESDDAGKSWHAAGLAGQSVRALALAPSDPNILIAGTLDGVYRSIDAAKSWQRISPANDRELKNLDSLAIDPRDPKTIYAGTFHLPWKTTDGGRTWRAIHAGMIDDSDVMSLLIDRNHPARIYSSACSGIYRSEDGASRWRKIQGIPYAARRTYAIAQDPQHPTVVFAATSEGLWKTADAGVTWKRTTPAAWVINSVAVPDGRAGRVVIGTERLGVWISDDNGVHFREANNGFSHRQILALALDPGRSGRILAVLANAPATVMVSDNDGLSWTTLGPGLKSEAVRRVYASPQGWLASLARGGLMRFDPRRKIWERIGRISSVSPDSPARSGSVSPSHRFPSPAGFVGEVVNDMSFNSARWYMATENGLFVSSDQGNVWKLNPVGPLTTLPVRSVRVSNDGRRIWVASLRGLVFSIDAGKTWAWHDLPLSAGGATTLDVDRADRNLLIATAQNGLYISRDGGITWQLAGAGLPSTPVQGLAISGNVLLASMRTGGLFLSSDSGRTWARVPGDLAGGSFPAVLTNESGVIFAASSTDGLYAVDWPAAKNNVGH